jgi:5'-deoxynucleotidase YfbR-like HD superfamily hydrolase
MDPVVRYIHEAGMLKRVERSGWWVEKVKHPESVADHSFRTAVVAFILAKMEGCEEDSTNRICTAAVFHDMHETRLLDLNKITARYIRVDRSLERKVERDQIEGMESGLKDAMLSALRLTDKEEMILKDADYLECAFQAKEYSDIGHPTGKWIERIATKLRTKSAKELIGKMKKGDSGAWSEGLRRFD